MKATEFLWTNEILVRLRPRKVWTVLGGPGRSGNYILYCASTTDNPLLV